MSTDVRGKSQSAYRIIVRSGKTVLWNSGKVKSSDNYGVQYDGNILDSKTRYDWTVTVWDEDGEHYVSETSSFETGIFEGDWSSEWIGDGENASSASRAATLLRTTFDSAADKEVEKARAYISGLGLYELKINGKTPDDSVLNTVNTDYNYAILYDVFDVTELLQKGNNAICVELGKSE